MKLLCVTYEYPPVGGGGAAVARGLAESLVKGGHEVDCVTSCMAGLEPEETVGGVRVHRVRCLRAYKHYARVFELVSQVVPSFRKTLELDRQGTFALNHTHFIFPSGLTSYLLWKRTGLPYVITAHGSDIPQYNPDRFHLAHVLAHPLWKLIVANAAMIVSPSHFLKGMIARNSDVPVAVIPNGADLVNLPAPVEKRDRILLVSRLFERKGVQYFLEAVRDLDTNWEILVAGDGPYLDTLKEIAGKVRPKVRFLGFVDRKKLAEIYASSRIFVFPSTQENFPVVLLEAMHAGCAVITTDAEGCAEVVGDAGIITKSGDAGQIRRALDELMSDRERMGELGEKARKRVVRFSWKTISKQYMECFNRVVSEQKLRNPERYKAVRLKEPIDPVPSIYRGGGIELGPGNVPMKMGNGKIYME